MHVQEDPSSIDPVLRPSSLPRVVLHAANFALPADRDDYGPSTVETMGRGGVFIALIEFDRASAGRQLFSSSGIPVPLRADDFSADQLIRRIAGQCGLQRFFRVGPRAFCLYTVIGSRVLRGLLTAEANRILASLAIN